MKKQYIRLIFIVSSLFFSLNSYASPAALFRDPSDPTVGDPNAKVSVAEFFDYRCIHCINTATAVDNTIKSHPEIRFVFKELPVFGEPSTLGAKAALAANKQGKYYDFHYALLTSKKSINDALIESIAKQLKLDFTKLKKDMESKEVANEIKATRKLAFSSGVRGTPAFFFGKTDAKKMDNIKLVLGEMTEADLNKAIEKASS